MFGENLKTLRKQKGFSQEELATRLHVVRQTISKWEKNLSVPDADTLIRLAEILGVSAIILAAIVLINIFIAVFFSVPNLNEGIQSNQPEITDQIQNIEE